MPFSVIEPRRVVPGEIEGGPFAQLSRRQAGEAERGPVVIHAHLQGGLAQAGEGHAEIPAIIAVGDHGTLAPEGLPFLPYAYFLPGIEAGGARGGFRAGRESGRGPVYDRLPVFGEAVDDAASGVGGDRKDYAAVGGLDFDGLRLPGGRAGHEGKDEEEDVFHCCQFLSDRAASPRATRPRPSARTLRGVARLMRMKPSVPYIVPAFTQTL